MKQGLLRRFWLVAYSLICFSCNNSGPTQPTTDHKTNAPILHEDSLIGLQDSPNSSQKRALIKQFFDELHIKKGFNGNVLISQRGRVIFQGTYGWFNKEKGEPLTNQSVFQLASLSKQFTAVAILILMEEKKLTLEDDVKKYFPQFPYDGITIRLLLTHRSGLPDYRYFCEEAYCCKSREISNDELIRLMCEKKPKIYYKPDTHFDYNNTNYVLLASIIEKVSGVSYADFLKKRIFEPLGMKNTFVYKGMDVPPGVALGYSANWRRVWNDYLNGTVGDKNIYSNTEDLFKWDCALYTEKLVKQTTLQLAYLAYSKELKTHNYGFGFRLKCLPNGDDLVFHGGWWRGYNHLYYRRLKDQTAIIVLSNRVNFVFNNLSKVWEILDETCSNPKKFEGSI